MAVVAPPTAPVLVWPVRPDFVQCYNGQHAPATICIQVPGINKTIRLCDTCAELMAHKVVSITRGGPR